ncbi:hypothetical protein BD310DRAFT_995343 [Dichomitus squalens]|uniref:Uncharacterized protein n=1 Tax=Dichomitus squalens TaxID=114155 RepID=A0A4Q9Q2J8_9APHY|nr:hypothetical protein BD310DRAFT_995343 [Dichomitus squalens]
MVYQTDNLISAPAAHWIEAFDGLVAGPSFHSGSIMTSPNATFVPRFAIAHSEVTTFTDGRWGRHEYSRWPQAYDHDLAHVACIPRVHSELAPKDDILWQTWQQEDWTTVNSGVVRMGLLHAGLFDELERAALRASQAASDCQDLAPSLEYTRQFLLLCLRHCLDRLRTIPADRSVIIALAAHVQRLSLELVGLRVHHDVVSPRMTSTADYQDQLLDVVGAHTADPSLAQLLHRVGVPVWLHQPFRPSVAIWQVVPARDLPIQFSRKPAYPCLVLALRDLSGALNTAGEAQRAMTAAVYRQLCASQLPQLRPEEECDAAPGMKRPRLETQWPNGWDSTVGNARPVIFERDAREAKTLPHELKSPAPRMTYSKCRSARDRRPGKSSLPVIPPPSKLGFVMNPFRKQYASRTMQLSPVWLDVLTSLEPLPQPTAAVTYYFPPPWMLDCLDGYDAPRDRLLRYIQHFASIRMFCRLRLFDQTIAGRPLTISEWRDALWGDYEIGGHSAPDRSGATSKDAASARAKVRHRLKQSLRELFGKHAGLSSYDPASAPHVGQDVITAEVAETKPHIQHRLVWEAHKTNWRCELLALDALMTGSRNWGQMERWAREAHVSEVWGSPRSGMDICPDWESPHVHFCWSSPPEDDWESSRPHLKAFIELLSRWPGRPAELGDEDILVRLQVCDAKEFLRVQTVAVRYYVDTFIDKFQRLPTPPVRDGLRVASSLLPRSPPPADEVQGQTVPDTPSARPVRDGVRVASSSLPRSPLPSEEVQGQALPDAVTPSAG